jgi:hypothetical protein
VYFSGKIKWKTMQNNWVQHFDTFASLSVFLSAKVEWKTMQNI